MKSQRRSLLSSTRASHRRSARTGGSTLVEPQCLAGVPMIDTATGRPLKLDATSTAVPYSMECGADKVSSKRPSKAIDPEILLQFSQQLYAHALTLQEVIRSEGEVAYDALRSRCERQAAQQFEIFYRTADEPAAGVGSEPVLVGDRST